MSSKLRVRKSENIHVLIQMNSSFKIFCNITSIAATIVCFLSLTGVYLNVSLLPLAFFFFVNVISFLPNIWRRFPLSTYFLIVLLWIRMVFLSLYGALDGFFTELGDSIEMEQYLIPSLSLCLYDCVAITLFFVFLSFRKERFKIESPKRDLLYGRREIYVILIAVALFAYFSVGRALHLYDFAIKPVGGDYERESEFLDARSQIIRQLISSGILFLFFIILEACKKKQDLTRSNRFFYYSLICAILFIFIITGERRTSQLYKAFASIYVLLKLFPKNRKKIISCIGLATFGVLALMTIYKHFNAFLFDSYYEAVQNSSITGGFSYGLLDAYFYGPNTIAKNIYYGRMIDTDFGQFLYDFFRNVFGLNFFVPGGRLLTSQIYNSIIYSGNQMTGFLISSIGYGYLYCGFALAPFVTIFNVVMMVFLEKNLMKCRTIEWQYVWAFIFIRFAFGALGSSLPLLNLTTRFFIINGLIIGIARLFKYKTDE